MFLIVGLVQLPWSSGERFKNYFTRYENMVGVLYIARDGRRVLVVVMIRIVTEGEHTGGIITLELTTGGSIFSYTCHPSDRDSLIEGLLVAGEALFPGGATEIVSSIR